MSSFWLCNKEYEYKLTPDSFRYFKEKTGNCLYVKTLEYRVAFIDATAKKLSDYQTFSQVGKVLGFVDTVYFLKSIITDSNVSIEEIQNGMLLVGGLPSGIDTNGGKAFSYVELMILVTIDIIRRNESQRSDLKKKTIADF